MTRLIIPQLGDFDEVEVIEIHIKEGDSIEKDDPLITLETEKAAMDVPSEFSGTITSLNIQLGDKISEGDLIGEIASEIQEPENQQVDEQKNNDQEKNHSSETELENIKADYTIHNNGSLENLYQSIISILDK